jgi:hypothetical protein
LLQTAVSDSYLKKIVQTDLSAIKDRQIVEQAPPLLPVWLQGIEQRKKLLSVGANPQVGQLMQNDVVETGAGLLGKLRIEADVSRGWIAAAPLARHGLNEKPVDLYT